MSRDLLSDRILLNWVSDLKGGIVGMITLLLVLLVGFWLFSFLLDAIFHPIKTVKKICGFVGFVMLLFLGLALL